MCKCKVSVLYHRHPLVQSIRNSLSNLDDTLCTGCYQITLAGERDLSDATRLHNATGHRTDATQSNTRHKQHKYLHN
jgi:hypothetical protein